MSCTIPTINAGQSRAAVYEWRDISTHSDDQVSTSLSLAKGMGINTVLLNVDRFIEISEIADQSTRDTSSIEYADRLSSYISQANSNGIRVTALAGGPEWYKTDRFYITEKVLDDVQLFNSAHTSKFDGIEFDVEPYTTSEYKDDKELVITKYIQYVDKVLKASINDGVQAIPIGFSIPFWLDESDGEIKQIQFNDAKKLPVHHLIDLVKPLGGSITVMAYRNTLGGPDGVYKHAQSEVDYAQKVSAHRSIVIAQETTDIQPDKVTYFGPGYDQAVININAIVSKFSGNKVFKGISINDLESLDKLYSNSICKDESIF